MQEFYYKQWYDETFIVIAYQGDEPEVVIPDMHWGQPVTIISDDVFKGHEEITSVHIPDTVTDIGGFVFDGCKNLHHVTLPSHLENMWQYAFARSGVEEIVLPPKVRSIVPFTFKDCKQLKRIVCNDGLTEICSWAFGGCDQLKEVVHGPLVKVSDQAFEWHR